MRHRGWVDVAALLLMAGAAWLVRDARTDHRLDVLRQTAPDTTGFLRPLVWVAVACAAALALASVAMLVAGRVPHLARSSPPVAGVLVLLGAGGLLYGSVRFLSHAEAWKSYSGERLDVLRNLLQPITGLLCLAGLALGIGLTLLARRSGTGPAATGAAVLWGAVTAVVLVRNPATRLEVGSMLYPGLPQAWLYGLTGLLVVAAGLLVTAWCAGPPADRDKVLARSRGGYAAVALLLPQVAAVDISFATITYGAGRGPDNWWLLLHAGLILGTAVAAAGAALWPAATPPLAAAVAVLGLAAGAVTYLPAADPAYVRIISLYPLLVGTLAPMVLAGVVACAYLRMTPGAAVPRSGAPEPGAPEAQPVA
jgi:hypothetical protein